MHLIQKESLSLVLRWLLEAVFVIGVLILIFLYEILTHYYMWYFGGDSTFLISMSVLLYFTGFDGLVIIRMLIGLFDDIHHCKPFVLKNAMRLKYISICCFIAGVAFLTHCFIYPSIVKGAVTFIIFIAALACQIVSQLFYQAVDYKSENDLTV